MDIKTSKTPIARSSREVPPPDKIRPRKKSPQKLGNHHGAGRRLISVLKIMGKISAGLLLAAILFKVANYAFSSDIFTLRTVQIIGCKHLDEERVKGIIAKEFSDNLLQIDLQQVKERLEKETWAKQVSLRRILPSELIITFQERVPAVTLEMNGELMVADNEGILLSRYDPQIGKLDVPVFKGTLGDEPETYVLYQEENSARIGQGLAMLAEIVSGSPQYARIISEVDISDRSNLKLLLVDDTAEVYLGDKDYLARFQKFVNNPDEYRKLKDQAYEIEVIDLRFDHKIVYKTKQAQQAAAALGKKEKSEEQRRRNR